MPLNNLKQKIVSTVILISSFLVISTPLITYAAAGAGNPGNGIQNPIGATTIGVLITNVITFLLGLVAILALLAIIIGGIYIILGFANEEYVKQGKSIIKWAIIGLIIVGAAYAILNAAVGLLGISPAGPI